MRRARLGPAFAVSGVEAVGFSSSFLPFLRLPFLAPSSARGPLK